MRVLLPCVASAILWMSSIATATAQEPVTLDGLMSTVPESSDTTQIPEIRYNAIRETAQAYGARAGLARRAYEINQQLQAKGSEFDRVWNFQALMLDGNVLPPVIVRAADVYDQKDDLLLRLIDQTYRIHAQARFTYAPPTWRTYLIRSYAFDPKQAVAAVSPTSGPEERLWRQAVVDGYQRGVAQAEANLAQNLARLQRDFLGMVEYRRLLALGMVTKPFVASSTIDVATTKDGDMHVGEVVMRITVTPSFVPMKDQWEQQPSTAATTRIDRAKASAARPVADQPSGNVTFSE